MVKVRREKMQVREKVGKSRNTVYFPMFRGSGGSKNRLAKAACAEPARQMKDENLHSAVARSTFGSQNVQNTTCSDHFLTIRLPFYVEKVHAAVARSTFGSQKCQNLQVL